jgi:NAD(P)-dependent dehydrogenase (short-subunit alcohol dehydrogenase family)
MRSYVPSRHPQQDWPGRCLVYPEFKDKLVIVTGGASGIGADMVRAFHRVKSRVVFFDVDSRSASALRAELASGAECNFVNCDLRAVDAFQTALDEVLHACGPPSVLINNAARDDRDALSEISQEQWDECLAINLRHHVFAIQAVAPHMAETGGAIINLGSVAWMRGQPAMVGYHASKAAIAGITRALARELGPSRVRINSIAPGAVVTDRQNRLWMTPEKEASILAAQALKFRIRGAHIANVALFLASAQSEAITGQTIIVDAGFTLN